MEGTYASTLQMGLSDDRAVDAHFSEKTACHMLLMLEWALTLTLNDCIGVDAVHRVTSWK